MNDKLIKRLVGKAEEDYLVATTVEPAKAPGAICFHCQQCIEKYLTALIVKHGYSYGKIHRLLELMKSAARDEPALLSLATDLRVLDGYAVAPRYPESYDPTPAEAEAARLIMETVRSQLRSFFDLSPEESPPKNC